MGTEEIGSFLADLPKCEHHVHIEGCLSPTLQFQLAERNKIHFPTDDLAFVSPEALQNRYERFSSLDDFLHYYYVGQSTLRTVADFQDLALEYLRRAWKDGVRHAEIFFDPQAHTERGIAYSTVLNGLTGACRVAEADYQGLTTMLIPCFQRHLPAEGAMEMLKTMEADLKAGTLAAVGLDSSEVGFPCVWWRDVYARAKELGIRRTAHAGEEGGPGAIREAIAELDVMRIDHGVAMARDSQLMQEISQRRTLVTVCPVSNVKLRVFDSLDQFPIRTLMEHKIRFSINSDDPAFFGAYVLDCYKAVQKTFNLKAIDWIRICTSSIEGSWCSKERKSELRKLLQQACDDHFVKASYSKGKAREHLSEFWSKKLMDLEAQDTKVVAEPEWLRLDRL